MRTHALLALATVAVADTGRDLLFSDPSADLPDVVLSDSVVYINEGGSFYYTVKLSHPPGMREDKSVDLLNDEVRIYLTSSQEVYQQGTSDATGSANFKQLLGHRAQLQINTNTFKCVDPSNQGPGTSTKYKVNTGGELGKYTDKNCFVHGFNPETGGKLTDAAPNAYGGEGTGSPLKKGICHKTLTPEVMTSDATKKACEAAGNVWEPTDLHYNNPLPFVYVAYSTRNPGQKSVETAAGTYDKVCPLCTHPKYCMQSKPDLKAYADDGGIIPGSNKAFGSNVYGGGVTSGFNGCLTATYIGFAPVIGWCQGATGTRNSMASKGDTAEAQEDYAAGLRIITPGTAINFCANVKKDEFTGVSYKQGTNKYISLVTPYVMGVGVAPAAKTGELSPVLREDEGDTKVLGWFPGEDAAGAANNKMVGNSDYRIKADGAIVTRLVPKDDTKCRYCAMPGLKCESHFDTQCTPVEISGGDTAAGYCTLPVAPPAGIAAFAVKVTHTAGAEKVIVTAGADADAKSALLVAAGFREGDIITIEDKTGQDCPAKASVTGAPDEYIIKKIAAGGEIQLTGQVVVAAEATGAKCILKRKVQKSGTYTSKYACEEAGLEWTAANWRGDVSSGAQLVFDSSNWNIAQTVQVTARQDDVYEPEVFGRGQDAYVHHFVVAQDANLQHTYYDDIDVNALTVSITDDDSAVVLQDSAVLTPTETKTYEPGKVTTGRSLGVESAGCSDPSKTEYNLCTKASSCYGHCATPVVSGDDDLVMNALATGPFSPTVTPTAPTAMADLLAKDTATVKVAASSGPLFAVGDQISIGDAAGQVCAGRGIYQITAVAVDGVTFTVTDNTASPFKWTDATKVAAPDKAKCTISRACPVKAFTTQATCEATQNDACFIDAVGTAKVAAAHDTNHASYTDRAKCQGTDDASKAGTCEGWKPRPGGESDACKYTGSTCANKKDCVDNHGSSAWTPKGYTWIGDEKNKAFLWVKNSWSTGADEIKIRLASEPMYDVTVYMQSGVFFEEGKTATTATMLPDDEQLMFQDKGQYETCYTSATGVVVECPAVKVNTKVHGCDAHGHFVTGQSYWDQSAMELSSRIDGGEATELNTGMSPHQLPTMGHDKASCSLLAETACKEAMGSGCVWANAKCAHTPDGNGNKGTKAMDLVCAQAAFAAGGHASGAHDDTVTACNKPQISAMGCYADANKRCRGKDLGYDCNSFLTFSSTNWNTWQTMKVIAVPDDDDEVATLDAAVVGSAVAEGNDTPSYGERQSKIGYLMTSADWYYTSDGAQLIDDSAIADPVRDGAAMGNVLSTVSNALSASGMNSDASGADVGTYAGLVTSCAKGGQSSCGSGAILSFTVFGGDKKITGVQVTSTGSGYVTGNVLTVAKGQIATHGADTTFTLAAAHFKSIGMFTTRFGDHINRYPVTPGSTSSLHANMPSSTPTDVVKIVVHNDADKSSINIKGDVRSMLITGDRLKISEKLGKTCLAAGKLANGHYLESNAGFAAPTYDITKERDDGIYTVVSVEEALDGGNTKILVKSTKAIFDLIATTDATACEIVHLRCFSTSGHYSKDNWAGGKHGRTQASYGCKTVQDFSTVVAKNQVCLETKGQTISPSAHTSRQVTKFSPEHYATDGITCGATSHTQDVNVRGVVISRNKCEATEGRRHYYVESSNGVGVGLARPTALKTRTGLYVDNTAKLKNVPTNEQVTTALKSGHTVVKKAVAKVETATKNKVEMADSATADLFIPGSLVLLTHKANTDCGTNVGYHVVASIDEKNVVLTAALPEAAAVDKCEITGVGWSSRPPIDFWTARNFKDGAAELGAARHLSGATSVSAPTKTMSMPTCPFTIGLTSAPAEGKTVVVKVHEDTNTAELRDNELYFYEEPTFRDIDMDTVMNWKADDGTICEHTTGDVATTAPKRSCMDACDLRFPGSVGILATDQTAEAKPRCFIQNVPCTGSAGTGNCVAAVDGGAATAAFVGSEFKVTNNAAKFRRGDRVTIGHVTGTDCPAGNPGHYTVLESSALTVTLDRALTGGGDSTKCNLKRPATQYVPNGGKAIDVKFTDDDWNIPRRITVIALNDDVDEPHEERKVYFTMGWNADGIWQGAAASNAASDDPVYRDAPRGTLGAPQARLELDAKMAARNADSAGYSAVTSGTSNAAVAGKPTTTGGLVNTADAILPVYSGYQCGTDGLTHEDKLPTVITGMGPGQFSPPALSPYITPAQVAVKVVDDDIADLVVLCGQNAGPGAVTAATSGASTVAPAFNSKADVATAGTAGTLAANAKAAVAEGDRTASKIGTLNTAIADGVIIGFAMDAPLSLGFIGSYDDALSSVESRKIQGLHEDATHMSRAGYSAEDGLAYAGEYSFGGGDHYDGDNCVNGRIGSCGHNKGMFPTIGFIKVSAIAAKDAVKFVTATSMLAEGYRIGDTIMVQTDPDSKVVCKASGTYDIIGIDQNGLGITVPSGQKVVADPNAAMNTCVISRPSGYISGVTLTAADRDIASPNAAVASPCTSKKTDVLEGTNNRCYPDTFVDWTAYDPYTDKYYTKDLTFTANDGAEAAHVVAKDDGTATTAPFAAVNADLVGRPAAFTSSDKTAKTITIGASVAAFKVGDKLLITPLATKAKCLIAGLYTVKSVGADKLTTEETHLGGTNCAASGACLAAECEMRLADAGVADTDANMASGQVRGFKGLGPAQTEGTDEYACTIHTRECTKTTAGFCYGVSTTVKDATLTSKSDCEGTADRAWGYWTDSENKACEKANVGSFQVRLNSSPGQKSVRRQYVGETTTVTEKELVYVVITPDATAQTEFEPSSVTFTETGGLVNGAPTHKWDKPVLIDVRPVDDKVDERNGVTVDFTAFSVTQSHHDDEYWTYTTTYQNKPVADAQGKTGYCNDPRLTCDFTTVATPTKCGVPLQAVVKSTNKLTVSGTIAATIKLKDKLWLKSNPNGGGDKTCTAVLAGLSAPLYVIGIAGNVIEVSTTSGGSAAGTETEANADDCLLYAAGEDQCTAANFATYGTSVGTKHTFGSASTFRATDATLYRHTIRTIHTLDNDFAGVTVDSAAMNTESCVAKTSANNAHCAAVITNGGGRTACEALSGNNEFKVPEQDGAAICNYSPGKPVTHSLLMGGATAAGALHAGSHFGITTAPAKASVKLVVTTVTHATNTLLFGAQATANVGQPRAIANTNPGLVAGDKIVVASVNTKCNDGTETAANSKKTDADGCCAAAGTYTIKTVDTSGNGNVVVHEALPVEANANVQCVMTRPAVRAGEPGAGVGVSVTEGGTYSYYTLKLDTQPAKIQRQAGTEPNADFAFTSGKVDGNCGKDNALCDVDGPASANGAYNGASVADHFQDHTKRMRPASMGTVEPPEEYWVDVTATQTIHIDLATPASCPTTAIWGGGSNTGPLTDSARGSGASGAGGTIAHPRYPYNGLPGVGMAIQPYDEVNRKGVAMSHYLTTCGGWQRDATYRFTASNWFVPQFVYLYAHNDADGKPNAGHVSKVVKAIAAVALSGTAASTSSALGTVTIASLGSFSALSVGDRVLLSSASSKVCDGAGRYTITKIATATFTVKETLVKDADADSDCVISRPAYPGNDASVGGSESTDSTLNTNSYLTTIRHYVETEDTMDNMKRTTGSGLTTKAVDGNTHGIGNSFVQHSKHGGIYTWGNIERFPFGRPAGTDKQNSYGHLHETGFTTYGYSSYESLYGYVEPNTRPTLTPTAITPPVMCKGSKARMGAAYDAAAVQPLKPTTTTVTNRVLTVGFADDKLVDAGISAGDTVEIGTAADTCALVGIYTVHSVKADKKEVIIAEQLGDPLFKTATTAAAGDAAAKKTINENCQLGRTVAVFKSYSGRAIGAGIDGSDAAVTYAHATLAAVACTDPDDSKPYPYIDADEAVQAGTRPAGGDLCIPWGSGWGFSVAKGDSAAASSCVPFFAEDSDLEKKGIQTEEATGAGTSLYQPPKNVEVYVTDNDAITEQASPAVAGCRSTQLFQYAQSKADDTVGQQKTKQPGNGVFKTQWLTDYNCKSGDAGGLPGYPVETKYKVLSSTNQATIETLTGYCTDGKIASKTKSICETKEYCTIEGKCVSSGTNIFNARVEEECGVCSGIAADEGSGQARYTKTECVKAIKATGTPDGTWSAYTWTAITSNMANCGSSGLDGFTATGTSAEKGVVKKHVWVPKPLGDATVSLPASKAGNLQCCTCVPAYGSNVAASTLLPFVSQTSCETVGSKPREGALWSCKGVGPSCTLAPGFQGAH